MADARGAPTSSTHLLWGSLNVSLKGHTLDLGFLCFSRTQLMSHPYLFREPLLFNPVLAKPAFLHRV